MSLTAYALIALGGALGSVARAWLGTALAALTGPAFPWGTIAINVLGSFVIGLFGTLTATDGRFAASFDVRAFVMVGLCGGFTTFSSFSLQTLELLRDGRPGQALGNAVLSVALCLASVAAGYSLALAVRTARVAVVADWMPGTTGSRTVVALHRPEAMAGMLAAARQLTGDEAGRTTVLVIDGPALAAFQPTEEVMTAERRADRAVGLRAGLGRWRAGQNGHPARAIAIRGDAVAAVLEHARRAHLLLLERRPDDVAAPARLHAALIRAGRPVLLLPSSHDGRFGRVIAVAWPPGAGAVRMATPLLSAAERVVVLQVGEAQALPASFGRWPTQSVVAAANGADTGAQLLAMAHKAGADLLVVGCESRGRRREGRFDAVTDSLLRIADLPMLMRRRDT